MKYITLLILTLLTITGCTARVETPEEAAHRRQVNLIHAQGNADAKAIRAQNGNVHYDTSRNGYVTDYDRGYNSHNNNPSYHHNSGIDAGDVLLGAALVGGGMVAANMFSSSNWERDTDSGQYRDKNGKYISEKEYLRRKEQSLSTKEANKQRQRSSEGLNSKSNTNVPVKVKVAQKGRSKLVPKVTPKPRATPLPKSTPTVNRTKKTNMSFGNTKGSNKGWNGNKQTKKAPPRTKKNTRRPSRSKPKNRSR